MSPGEIARRLEDVVREVRGVADKMLLREVYDAQRAALDQRLTSLENDRAANRRWVYTLAGTIVASVIVQIVTALMNG